LFQETHIAASVPAASPTVHSIGWRRYAELVRWVVPMFFAPASRPFIVSGTSAPSGTWKGSE